jgi:hypothetical protein
MRWRVGSAFAAVAMFAAFCSDAAVAETPSRYSLADQCRTLQVGGGLVARSGLGYAVGVPAERFYMKASGLGSYSCRGPTASWSARGRWDSGSSPPRRPGRGRTGNCANPARGSRSPTSEPVAPWRST